VDRYSFAGELATYGPDGKAERRSRYRGQVEGHRPSAMRWDGGGAAANDEARHPLELASALQASPATVEYLPGGRGRVKLRITLDPGAAKERVARPLRSRLSGLRREAAGRLQAAAATPDAKEAAAKPDRETKRLEGKLSTLRVVTVCEWTADRRTWFPSELREETTIAYRQDGRDVVEKTTSVTNFRK
jgi:hypothetical protein